MIDARKGLVGLKGYSVFTNRIRAWFRGEDARDAFDADVARLGRDAGTRFARGNVALQLGAARTIDDLERARSAIRQEIEKESSNH